MLIQGLIQDFVMGEAKVTFAARLATCKTYPSNDAFWCNPEHDIQDTQE